MHYRNLRFIIIIIIITTVNPIQPNPTNPMKTEKSRPNPTQVTLTCGLTWPMDNSERRVAYWQTQPKLQYIIVVILQVLSIWWWWWWLSTCIAHSYERLYCATFPGALWKGMSSVLIDKFRCWAMDHGDDQVVGSRPSDLPRRMPDIRTYCDDDVVRSADGDRNYYILTFHAVIRVWPITDDDSVLYTLEDHVVLQSLSNTTIAPPWQFTL